MKPSTAVVPTVVLAALLCPLGEASASADPLPLPLPSTIELPVPLPTELPSLLPLPTSPPAPLPTVSSAPAPTVRQEAASRPVRARTVGAQAAPVKAPQREQVALPTGTAAAPLLSRTASLPWSQARTEPRTPTVAAPPAALPVARPSRVGTSTGSSSGIPGALGALAVLLVATSGAGTTLALRRR